MIPGKLIQIDSGPFGRVWGVNRLHNIFCRTKISWYRPQGHGWLRVPGRLRHVSVGDYGAWGCNAKYQIFFRRGITKQRPNGKWFKFYQNFETFSLKVKSLNKYLQF